MLKSADRTSQTPVLAPLLALQASEALASQGPAERTEQRTDGPLAAGLNKRAGAGRSNPVRARTTAERGMLWGLMRRSAAIVTIGAAVLLSGCATHRISQGPSVETPAVVQTASRADQARMNTPSADARYVKALIGDLERTILEDATPPMAVLFEPGHSTLVRQGSYKKHIVPKVAVTNLGPTGEIGALMLLPVSGHVGDSRAERNANARHYADIDLHRIWLEKPDGTTEVLYDAIAANGRLVTPQDIVAKLQPGVNVLCWDPMPGKTGGVDGFPSGRSLELEWDGR